MSSEGDKHKMEDYKKYFDGLSDEMRAKVKSCKSSEELISLAKTEGIELTNEQLDAISGGGSVWSCDYHQDQTTM